MNVKWINWLAVILTAALLSACGAKQTNKTIANLGWQDLYNAVPADAAMAFSLHVTEESAASSFLGDVVQSMVSPTMGQNVELLYMSGLLVGGDVLFFNRPGEEWMIAKVKDVGQSIEEIVQNKRTLPTYAEERDGELIHAAYEEPGVLYDILGTQQYVMVRQAKVIEGWKTSDMREELSTHWAKVGRYAHARPKLAQNNTIDANASHGWAMLDVANFNRKDQIEAGSMAEDIEVCRAENERLATAVPGIDVVFSTDKSGYNHVNARIRLSPKAQERGKSLMRGAPAIDGLFQGALAAIGVSFDYGTFFETLQTSTKYQGCYGVAGLAGELAAMHQRYERHILFNARTVSGTGAIVVHNIALEGFIPTGDIGVYIDSPSADGLFIRISRALAKMAKVETVSDASMPTIMASLEAAPMRIRVQNQEDRVIVSTEKLPDAIGVALKSVQPHQDPNVPFRLLISGKALASLIEDADEFVQDMEMDDPRIDTMIDQMKAVNHGMDARMFFANDGLLFELNQTDD